MATPVAHSLFALGVLEAFRGGSRHCDLRFYAFVIFAANAADLDFIPGMLVGDVNSLHRGVSHSLAGLAGFAVLVMLAATWSGADRLRATIAGSICYASHLLVDMFSVDARAPHGIPLFWPFSAEHFMAPWQFLPGVEHGVPGDKLSVFLGEVFSYKNLSAIGLEVMIAIPLFLIVLIRRKYSKKCRELDKC